MADYIDRQAAINAILAINDYGNSDRANALGLAELAITTLPPAGAVEAVRCKNCRYWDKTKYSDYATMGECLIWRAARNRKDFCSEGRKDE